MSIYLTEVGGQRIQLERKWKNKQETFVFKVIGLENVCTQMYTYVSDGGRLREGEHFKEFIDLYLFYCVLSSKTFKNKFSS